MSTHFPSGLNQAEVAERRARDGYNDLAADQHRRLWQIALEVAREPMFLLLLAAGAIYFAMGDAHEAAILLGFVAIIMAVTIFQEQRTEKALEALRDLSSPRAIVIRDGEAVRIPGREVVSDDIVMLVEGDRVPADGTLLEAHELAADESMLTGESVAVAKFPGAAGGAAPEQADRVWAGTLVVRGQGLMRVTAIGSRTELGRIGKSLQEVAVGGSPLQQEIAVLTRRLAVIGVGLCLVAAALYVAFRGGWLNGLLGGITLAMSILPQEFPVILIVFLAMGARRIAREGVLTRRLNAIETLGETTVLCVDKTGTLTHNRMALAALMVDGRLLRVADLSSPETLPESYHELLEYSVLASEIEPHDPMEQAFHRFAGDCLSGTEHLHPDWDLAREYELSPELMAMSHLWRPGNGAAHVVAAKGAPEAIADLCHLPAEACAEVAAWAERMADQGLRVLGVAKAEHRGGDWPAIQHDFDFSFIGLVGLADPLREEVPAAIAECRQAGIRVVMITGDHPRTARAIAGAAGIEHDRVLTGAELGAMNAAERTRCVREVGVFARVTPQQKLLIVEALKAAGDTVAMTGDGVNDAPALKAAHIGIAMGKRGTDVAREAAALVLLDENFATIVSAVRLGRRIFANLRQAMIYVFSVHIPIVLLTILPILFGWPLVLAPMHIAFMELVIDPACSVVFEARPGSADLMRRPPRPRTERLVGTRHLLLAVTQGLLASAVVALYYHWLLAHGDGEAESRAAAFVALIVSNAAMVVSSLSSRAGLGHALGSIGRVAGLVLGATLIALVAATGLPFLAEAFRFSPPTPAAWLAAFAVGTACLIPFEAAKWLAARLSARSGE
ncbi:MAG TPA: cation-translocating P-type ATPase [Parasulfuritortus sp.]